MESAATAPGAVRRDEWGSVGAAQAASANVAIVATIRRDRDMADAPRRGASYVALPARGPVTGWDSSSAEVASAARVFALVADPADRARLRGAVRRSIEFVFHAEVHEVLSALRASPVSPTALLLEPRDAHGRPSAGLARQVLTLFPGVPVIGYCQADIEHSQEILDLATAGVHELLFKHDDDADAAIRAVVASAHQACAGDVAYAAVASLIPVRLQPMIRYCLMYPASARSVHAVAQSLGVHRKTLVNRCNAAHLPAPGALVSWCQLLLVAHFLGRGSVTVESIARQLDFPSATALRNLLKRYTGMRPQDVRAAGGLPAVVEVFTRALEGEAPVRARMEAPLAG
jgi:AraC-like DNA-binding protein